MSQIVMQDKMQLIGQSAVFLQLLEHASKLAATDYPVIIYGERGTGKELIAHRLHFLSNRWEQPFVKVNCAALSPSLLESELFGHEAGSFTGAKARKIGRIERADGGTLFLDEIGSASAALQEKLLRVIEYGELERIGAESCLQVDVRFLAASHENLWTLAEQGKFRRDLLDRLAFDLITIPPLRDRPEDILPIAEHFAVKFSQELGRDCFPGFDAEAKKTLLCYPWPGNVRQLRHVVGRSLFHQESPGVLRDIRFLPHEAKELLQIAEPAKQQSISEDRTGRNPASSNVAPCDEAWAIGVLPRVLDLGHSNFMQQIERNILKATLSFCGNKQTLAAQKLGLSYHQFRGLLRKYQPNSHHLLRRKQSLGTTPPIGYDS